MSSHPSLSKSAAAYSHGSANIRADARLLRHICEGPVAVVMEQHVGLACVVERSRIVVRSVERTVFWIELDVAAHVNRSRQPSLVVVEPCGADRPAADLDAGFLGYVGEVAVAVVVVENDLPVSGYQQVFIAIVVEVKSAARSRPPNTYPESEARIVRSHR